MHYLDHANSYIEYIKHKLNVVEPTIDEYDNEIEVLFGIRQLGHNITDVSVIVNFANDQVPNISVCDFIDINAAKNPSILRGYIDYINHQHNTNNINVNFKISESNELYAVFVWGDPRYIKHVFVPTDPDFLYSKIKILLANVIEYHEEFVGVLNTTSY